MVKHVKKNRGMSIVKERCKEFFGGKKVTIMGLGLLGRGVGDARFIAKYAKQLIITDKKTEQELAESVKKLGKFKNIVWRLGCHKEEDFIGRDMIIKNAGVPKDSPFIAIANKNNVPVLMSTSIFSKLTEAKIIGITGTRGKSTVTQMIYDGLLLAKKKGEIKGNIFLGGNVRGVSTLEYLDKTKARDHIVLELDSWQLQGFRAEKISPQISVFTTFMRDHMNYYNNSMQEYFLDKAGIFENQKPDDVLVVGTQVIKELDKLVKNSELNKKIIPEIKGRKIIASENKVPKGWSFKIIGKHNLYNAGLAHEALKSLAVRGATIKKAFESFKSVPGRLELIKEKDGIKIYNDTNSTTPDASVVALEALGGGKKKCSTIIIMGGADKNLDMSSLYKALKKYAKKIILLPGTGSSRILNESDFRKLNPIEVGDLEQAFMTAMAYADNGDSVILSPAFASFGLFVNEYDRGDKFNLIVKKFK